LTSEEKPKKPLTTKEVIECIGLGFLIAITYTVFLIIIFEWIEESDYEGAQFILPSAHAQVQPFELELQQIRDPQKCTRKVLQGAVAYVPFTLKIFYDTTTDRKWDAVSKTQSFPVAQQSAQVATFFTNDVDQYEMYLEINYDRPKERQAFIEILSKGEAVYNHQEKFDDSSLCMTFFIKTVTPPTFPTRQELIGDLLSNVDQIPAMITSFNQNTITWNTSISFMWTLILGSLVVSVLTLISASVAKRGWNSKMKEIDESLNLVNTSALSMDSLNENFTENANKVIKNQHQILKNQAEILKRSPVKVEPEKDSKIKIITKKIKMPDFHHKKDEQKLETVEEVSEEGIEEDVHETLQFPSKEQKEESEKLLEVIKDIKDDEEEEPSGGFVIKEEKVPPPAPSPQKEEIPKPEPKPPKFKEVLREIDFEGNAFKEGGFDKFTYNELNTVYGWISHYKKRKMWTGEWEDIPKEVRDKQDIAEKIVYHAIFAKMNRKLKNGN